MLPFHYTKASGIVVWNNEKNDKSKEPVSVMCRLPNITQFFTVTANIWKYSYLR